MIRRALSACMCLLMGAHCFMRSPPHFGRVLWVVFSGELKSATWQAELNTPVLHASFLSTQDAREDEICVTAP